MKTQRRVPIKRYELCVVEHDAYNRGEYYATDLVSVDDVEYLQRRIKRRLDSEQWRVAVYEFKRVVK